MIKVKVSPQESIKASIISPEPIGVKIVGQTVRIGSAERYDGPYEVTPDFDTQTLETEEKLMTDDVTVYPIPVHRTTNPYGTTVYIGGILDG